MSKQEYLEKLRRALAQMPPEELEKQLAYYDELISDMCEDGMSEPEATARLGDPETVAAELLAALPLGTLVKTRIKSAGGLSALNIVLLVLGFPLWFSLLAAVGAVLLSVLVTLWSLALSFGAVVLALGLSALAIPAALVFGFIEGSPLMLIGMALAAAGLCVLGVLLIPPVFRGMAALCRAIGRGVKSIFIKKEK